MTEQKGSAEADKTAVYDASVNANAETVDMENGNQFNSPLGQSSVQLLVTYSNNKHRTRWIELKQV